MHAHSTSNPSSAKEPAQPVAAVLAFLFPGAGHFYLGHRFRGVMVAIGVMLLFGTGLLVGGIDSVDRRENGLWFWFYGQMWNGPIVFAVDHLHQTRFKVVDPSRGLRSATPSEFRNPENGQVIDTYPDPATGAPVASYSPSLDPTKRVTVQNAYPPKARSFGRVSELGTLFVAIAGMLNLVCIIDATFKHPAKRDLPRPRPTPQPA